MMILEKFILFGIVLMWIGEVFSKSENELKSEKLFDEYFKWKLEYYPSFGTVNGYHDYDSKLEEVSLQSLRKFEEDALELEFQVKRLMLKTQDGSKNMRYLKIMNWELETLRNGLKYQSYYLTPIDSIFNIAKMHSRYFELDLLRWKTEEDYLVNLERLKQIPRHIEQVYNMTLIAQKLGYAHSNESIVDSYDQFNAILKIDDVEDSKFYTHFKNIPTNISNSEEIQKEAKEIILNEINPALARLQNYVENDYLVRPNTSIESLPNSKGIYDHIIEWHTSLDGYTADEIHQIGLDETTTLQKQMEKDFEIHFKKKMTFSDIFKKYKGDDRIKFSNLNEIKTFVNSVLKNQIGPLLKDYFNAKDLSSEVYDLNIIFDPHDLIGAYYIKPSADGLRNGSYFIGVKDPSKLRRETLGSLTVHEAYPGHHLQSTHINNNNKNLPLFIRYSIHGDFIHAPAGLPPYLSYIEGWALYAEYLGYEMGIYDNDPDQLFGYYYWNLLRACRLVVDTGIHSKGWSTEKATQFMIENVGMLRSDAHFAVKRYITWPGQALAYKIGERIIKELRKKYESSNPDFNIKNFHSAILSCYGPLHFLSECVEAELST